MQELIAAFSLPELISSRNNSILAERIPLLLPQRKQGRWWNKRQTCKWKTIWKSKKKFVEDKNDN